MIFDARENILIGLATSVAANCQPCVEVHLAKAKENNISDQEIKEAINIGKTVKKGAAAHMDNFFAGINGENPCCAGNPCEATNPCAPKNPCACG
ncbi:MAG: alkylhydroperoxidase AhpD family core domain protein [Firmicutes bacterium]|nr:alkylhydroperoxidase AhpD family core domain protein [Bacillota bacterium]